MNSNDMEIEIYDIIETERIRIVGERRRRSDEADGFYQGEDEDDEKRCSDN